MQDEYHNQQTGLGKTHFYLSFLLKFSSINKFDLYFGCTCENPIKKQTGLGETPLYCSCLHKVLSVNKALSGNVLSGNAL